MTAADVVLEHLAKVITAVDVAWEPWVKVIMAAAEALPEVPAASLPEVTDTTPGFDTAGDHAVPDWAGTPRALAGGAGTETNKSSAYILFINNLLNYQG